MNKELCVLRSLVEINSTTEKKIKISPVGEAVGFDGRGFVIEPEVIIENIKNTGLDIPLDENHYFSKACGWFDKDSFEVREDGIYASLELNSLGKELIENKFYRYLSPAFYMDGRKVTGLDSVGLVNRPNLLTDALNSRKTHKEDKNMTIEELKAQLEQKEAELNDLKEKNSSLAAEKQELSTKLEEMEKKTKELQVDMAIEKNEILPAQREFALSLNKDALEKFIETNKASFEHLKQKTEAEENKQVDDKLLTFAKNLGLNEEQIKKYV